MRAIRAVVLLVFCVLFLVERGVFTMLGHKTSGLVLPVASSKPPSNYHEDLRPPSQAGRRSRPIRGGVCSGQRRGPAPPILLPQYQRVQHAHLLLLHT